MFLYNIKYSVLISAALFCSSISLFTYTSAEPGDEVVYEAAVNSVGFISDKSGVIASGFFINENTFITNHHVSNGLDVESAVIEMKDGSTFHVKNIIKDYDKVDLAILETKTGSPHSLRLEDENIPAKNDIVYSIGNPTDSKDKVDYFKMTKGRIKVIREDDWFYDADKDDIHNALVIQHTAMIKPGNSGGPLLNSDGKVIGVNTFFYDDSLNYAIHVDELIRILSKNGIAYNETISNKETGKKTDKKIRKDFQYLIERHKYFFAEYYYVIISTVLLYYMFITLVVISILTYLVIISSRKRM